MIFLGFLFVYWLLCCFLVMAIDLKDGELEEETALGNAFYYAIQVPIIIALELLGELFGLFTRKF